MKRWWIGAGALAAALAVALGVVTLGDDGNEPWVLEVAGEARLVRGDEERHLDGGEHRVADGDRIEVLAGNAVLTLPDDATLELRAGVGSADDSRLRVADVPELLDGEMLLLGAEDGTAAVAGAASVGVTEGAVRVRRGASVTVGAYEGSPSLEANGQEMEGFRPLRQATVTDSGALPRAVRPVTYDADAPDPWDVRFLGDAIDLDEQIERRRLSVTQNADRSDLGPVVQRLVGDVPVASERSVAETVVGAAIVQAGSGGESRERWREVFSFRDAGAPWGVVALDQRAERAAVLATLDDVVRGLVQRFGGVAAGDVDDEVAALPVLPGDGPSSAPGGSGPSDPGPSDPESPPPTTEPPPPPPTTPTVPPILPLPTIPGVDDDPDDPGGDGGDDGGSGDPTGEGTEVPIIGEVIDDLLDPATELLQPADGLL